MKDKTGSILQPAKLHSFPIFERHDGKMKETFDRKSC